MKRALSLILALLLISALALPAVAAETINGSTKVSVNYTSTIDTSYVMIIPGDVNVTDSTVEWIEVALPSFSHSTGFQNKQLKVTATVSAFKGATYNFEAPTFLGAGLLDPATGDKLMGTADDGSTYRLYSNGNGASGENLYYKPVRNEDDTDAVLSTEACWVTDGNGAYNTVDCLAVYNNLGGYSAPTDTYNATITYTADILIGSDWSFLN